MCKHVFINNSTVITMGYSKHTNPVDSKNYGVHGIIIFIFNDIQGFTVSQYLA